MKRNEILALAIIVMMACAVIPMAIAESADSDPGSTVNESTSQVTVSIVIGNEKEERTISSGETISLDAPSVEGKTFEGWFTDEKYTKQFDPAEPITESITIYAKITQEYSFYLVNTVSGEDSAINGWYKAAGYSPVDALCNALDAKGIVHTFKNSDASVFFGDKAISDWTTGAWASDGYYYGNQFAIWNYNEEKGWFMGNTFGSDADTVYIISHEKYLDADGPVATAYGIDNSKAWGDPADYDLVYDGVTGGYADAKMALVLWYKVSYGSGDLADYGISLKEGSEEGDVTTAAFSWMVSFKNEYTSVAGMDCSGSGWGYVQLAPRDLTAVPEEMEFGPEAYPSVVKYVIGDKTKTVVHDIGDKTPYVPVVDDSCTFAGWYAGPDFSGSPVTEISGDATLYAKITQKYSFYLVNTVSGENSTINGWYKATGYSPVDALCNALDAKGIVHTFKNSDASVFFGDKAISDWTYSWGTDGYYTGNNYAIWNYNEEKGWFTGNTFGSDADTVYIISHEKYIEIDGPVATAYGIDNSEVWGEPEDYDLVYDGVTGGYADAKMALIVWYRQSYGSGDPADFGISLKEGSDEDDVSFAAMYWMLSHNSNWVYTAVAGINCVGDPNGLFAYAQLAPRDLKSMPENVEFGPASHPSVVKYVIGDKTKTVVHAIGDKTPYVPVVDDSCTFAGWYAGSDFSGSPVTEISGDATLYAKIMHEHSFYLVNTVSGEDSAINGWYTAAGYSPVDALCNALDAKGIVHTFTNSDASVFFGDKAISDWTTGAWASDGYYYGNQFAIWNYNEEKGWFMGNTFGSDADTVYIISHEKYLDADGPVATAYGIDNSKAWGDPADYDLVYDGVTGGYADAKMALVLWYKVSYGSGDLADYGISLKEGSEEGDVTTAAFSWMVSFKNEYTSVAGMDCSGSGWGYVQLAPRDLTAAPEDMEFGLEAYPSVVKYVIGDKTKTVVHAIGDTIPYSNLPNNVIFDGWYASSDFSGSPVTEISGDATLYAKITAIPIDQQLIESVKINQFINGGKSVMMSVETNEKSPEKVLIVTYSAYVDLPEGRILDPFITETIEMGKDQTSGVFTPTKASKVSSLAVTCWYKIGDDTYNTPYVEAVTPVVSATLDLTMDQSLTLRFDGNKVQDGDTVDYGYYTVEVPGSESVYTVDGVVADGKNRLFYYGQQLVVKATS